MNRNEPEIKSFETVEEMFAWAEGRRRSADGDTKEWQRAVRPGDHVLVQVGRNEFAWGQVEDAAIRELEAGASAAEAMVAGRTYLPPSTGRLMTIHSPEDPGGSLYIVHVVSIYSWVAPELFQQARRAGWPNNRRTMAVEIAKANVKRDGTPSPMQHSSASPAHPATPTMWAVSPDVPLGGEA